MRKCGYYSNGVIYNVKKKPLANYDANGYVRTIGKESAVIHAENQLAYELFNGKWAAFYGYSGDDKIGATAAHYLYRIYEEYEYDKDEDLIDSVRKQSGCMSIFLSPIICIAAFCVL